MPQLAIKHGYLDEKYRSLAQGVEMAAVLYWLSQNRWAVQKNPEYTAAMAGAAYYVYTSYTKGEEYLRIMG